MDIIGRDSFSFWLVRVLCGYTFLWSTPSEKYGTLSCLSNRILREERENVWIWKRLCEAELYLRCCGSVVARGAWGPGLCVVYTKYQNISGAEYLSGI